MKEKEITINPTVKVPDMGETVTLGGYPDLPIEKLTVIKLNQDKNDQKSNQQS